MSREICNLPKLASLVLVALLASCGSTPQPAPLRVEIPVFTPCVKTEIPQPDYEFDKLLITATDGEIILALARDWPRSRKYEVELKALIAGCVPPESSRDR